MRKAVLLLVLLVVVVAVPAFTAGKGDAAKGKALFTSKCATCHGPAGEGKEAIFKMMKAEMHALGSKQVQDKTDAQIGEAVTKGTGKMKPVAGLKDDEIADIVAYVRSLKK